MGGQVNGSHKLNHGTFPSSGVSVVGVLMSRATAGFQYPLGLRVRFEYRLSFQQATFKHLKNRALDLVQ